MCVFLAKKIFVVILVEGKKAIDTLIIIDSIAIVITELRKKKIVHGILEYIRVDQNA